MKKKSSQEEVVKKIEEIAKEYPLRFFAFDLLYAYECHTPLKVRHY